MKIEKMSEQELFILMDDIKMELEKRIREDEE